MKYLKIINIDGTRGCGRSTQISLLRRYFEELGLKVLVNDLNDLSSVGNIHSKIVSFLKQEPDGLVINNGSIARPVVSDIVDGMPKEQIIDKYRDAMFLNDSIFFSYGVANVLLVLEDLNEAQARLTKRSKIMGVKEDRIPDLQYESDIVYGMLNFDDHIISKNIEFRYIEVLSDDSMMDVRDNILEYLKNHYEIKKPS